MKKQFYENKLRVRVVGLCFDKDKILLVRHTLGGATFYAPPGGAVEFGETIEEALKRELVEETNIEVQSAEFKFITEYVNPPLHAIEQFYFCKEWQGEATVGYDPEAGELPLIQDVNFYSGKEIKNIKSSELHHILHNCINPRELLDLSGYIEPPKKYNN